ncbi:hypothetical protein Fcan01_22044 [Folsomia candida]|uniref:Uncharacterized protein n=1 Tax=Folsomia candida TaxID=158441 RepID=A0A226DDE5_FOLCA|nr:hypothetical protein Fcan01_22044 [Folsomia candida]
MPTQHSPRKDESHDTSAMTNSSAELATNFTNLSNIISNKFEDLSKELLNKVGSIVDRVTILEKRQDRIEKKIDEVAPDVHSEIAQVREEMQEQTRRIHKVLNIVMMGVPETKEGIAAATKVMGIILPAWTEALPNIRIGDPNRKSPHPRPLRVTLRNAQEKSEALRNCWKLKDHQDLKTIAVRRDLTRKQQEEWKDNYSRERTSKMTTRQDSKRKRNDNATSSESQTRAVKQHKAGDNSIMEED